MCSRIDTVLIHGSTEYDPASSYIRSLGDLLEPIKTNESRHFSALRKLLTAIVWFGRKCYFVHAVSLCHTIANFGNVYFANGEQSRIPTILAVCARRLWHHQLRVIQICMFPFKKCEIGQARHACPVQICTRQSQPLNLAVFQGAPRGNGTREDQVLCSFTRASGHFQKLVVRLVVAKPFFQAPTCFAVLLESGLSKH